MGNAGEGVGWIEVCERVGPGVCGCRGVPSGPEHWSTHRDSSAAVGLREYRAHRKGLGIPRFVEGCSPSGEITFGMTVRPPGPMRTPARGVFVQPSDPTLVFLTVCTEDARPWLTSPLIHAALHRVWESEATAWKVGDYLLMPDHLHLFCCPNSRCVEIERWISYWKYRLSRTCPEAGRWQSMGFHHRLRSWRSAQDKWSYVLENPCRKGWISNWQDWPFKGRVFPIGWV